MYLYSEHELKDKAKRLTIAEETRQMLKKARKLREEWLARNKEMKETIGCLDESVGLGFIRTYYCMRHQNAAWHG